MEMAAQVHQVIINGGQLLLQHPAHLTGCIGGGVGGIRFDQVDDGLRLGQIQLAVEEGTLGEFASAGRTGTGAVQRFQPGGQHGRGAVAVEFHGVLAGVAVGSPGHDSHALVNDPALLVAEGAQHQLPVGCAAEVFFIL